MTGLRPDWQPQAVPILVMKVTHLYLSFLERLKSNVNKITHSTFVCFFLGRTVKLQSLTREWKLFFLPHDDLCRLECRFVSSSLPWNKTPRDELGVHGSKTKITSIRITFFPWLEWQGVTKKETSRITKRITSWFSSLNVTSLQLKQFLSSWSLCPFFSSPSSLYGNCFALSFYPLDAHFSFPQALHFS